MKELRQLSDLETVPRDDHNRVALAFEFFDDGHKNGT